jgi:hypothetical protein
MSETNERSVASTGSVPVAWAVVYPNDEVAVIAFKRRDADERASASDRVVPLYRHPQVTVRLPWGPEDFEISEANGYAAAMEDFKRALTEAGVEWAE